MQINKETRFDKAATVTTPRSRFLMHQNIRTTFNAGFLVPFFVDSDIMPGDTFKVKGTFVVRQSTPIYPTMDNSFLDVFFFFIPHRLVWDHWKEFWGENTTGSWTQQTHYTIPQLLIAKTGVSQPVQKGYALQYMGIPIGINNSATGYKINALPLRAYALTWNDWFRDTSVCPPLFVYKGDSDTAHLASNGNVHYGAYNTATAIPAECAPVYKYKDYFNACLPEPQKGNPITLPIGQSADVIFAQPIASGLNAGNADQTNLQELHVWDSAGAPAAGSRTLPLSASGSGVNVVNSDTGGAGQVYISAIADLSNAVAATINAQRMAFAAQRILEAKARTGSRYTEIIRGLFGVISPDARQQRPEYLGGKRIPITMNQVAQTSSTDSTSPQGNVAAFSLTVDSDYMFTKSFTEHGTLLGVLCVRQEHSYDQGLARMWSRKDVLDF